MVSTIRYLSKFVVFYLPQQMFFFRTRLTNLPLSTQPAPDPHPPHRTHTTCPTTTGSDPPCSPSTSPNSTQTTRTSGSTASSVRNGSHPKFSWRSTKISTTLTSSVQGGSGIQTPNGRIGCSTRLSRTTYRRGTIRTIRRSKRWCETNMEMCTRLLWDGRVRRRRCICSMFGTE